MKSHILTIFGVLIFSLASVFAQDLPLTHFMHLNPYQFYTNPTADLPYEGYAGIPAAGNSNIGIYNNALIYNKMFKRDENGYPTTFTSKEFINSLDPHGNSVMADLNHEILGFGLRIKQKFFFAFSYRLRANMEMTFSKDLPGFLLLGNMSYLGDDQVADMQLGLDGTAYQEFSFGFQHKVNEQWTWGVRPKLLFGAFNIQTQACQMRVHTDPSNYFLTFTTDIQARMASFIPYTMSLDSGRYDFQFEDFNRKMLGKTFANAGGAIDLGLRYNPIPELGISLSVLDLGFIQWKTSTRQIENELSNGQHHSDDGSFQFTGLTNRDIDLLTSEGGAGILLDSLADYLPLSSAPIDKYTTALRTRINAQIDYAINPNNRVSLLASGRIYNHNFYPSLTLAYNGSFFNIIDVCVAYTMQKRSYDNLGIGLGFDLGPVNLYFTTQNIIPVFSHTWLNKVNASAGIAINWGYAKHKKEAIEKKSVNAAVPASQH